MKRSKWVESGRGPMMAWGYEGDEIKNKETGEEYTLKRKESDGWICQSHHFNGVRGGSWHKFTFKELAEKFTEPETVNGFFLAE